MFSQNNEEKKLDWMYKGPTSGVDREEYLLGRSIDKTLEQLNTAEKQAQLPAHPPKNHVEHECIPPSIRDFKKQQLGEQVDLAQKLQEDPLIAIRKQEEETRQRLLQNPVQLKKLQSVLKERNARKDKKRAKKKRKKQGADDDSATDQYPRLRKASNDGDFDKVLIEKFLQFRHLLTADDFDEIVNLKSDSSDSDDGKKRSKKGRTKRKQDQSPDSSDGERGKSKSRRVGRRDSGSPVDRRRRATEKKSKSPVRKYERSRDSAASRGKRKDSKRRRDSSASESENESEDDRKPRRKKRTKNSSVSESDSSSSEDEKKRKPRKASDKSKETKGNKDRRKKTRDKKREKRRDSSSSGEENRKKSRKGAAEKSRDKERAAKRSRKREKSSSSSSDEDSSDHERKKSSRKCRSEDKTRSDKRKDNCASRSGTDRYAPNYAHGEEKRNPENTDRKHPANRGRNDRYGKRDSGNREGSHEDRVPKDEPKRKMYPARKPDDYRQSSSASSSSTSSDSDGERRQRKKQNFGLVRADGTKIHHTKTEHPAAQRQDKKEPEMPAPKVVEKHKRKRLTEEEIEQKRREMMENAEWRDNERVKSVQKYREDELKESKEQDYKPEFIQRELLKSANNSTVESRIKSNIYNIQRSSKDMSTHFSRR